MTADRSQGEVELTYEVVTDRTRLAALAPNWDELVRAMPRPSPFLLHGWVERWWAAFGEGRRLAVPVARRKGRLVAALPCFIQRSAGLRVAGFLGAHESALADAMLAPGEDERIVGTLIAHLRPEADLVDVFGLPARSRLASAATGSLHLIARVESPVLEMPDGWDSAYRRHTSVKKRALHERRRRQLAELGAVRIDVARVAADLERVLEEAFELHQKRWKGRPDGSTFGTPGGRAFHRDAIRAIAPHGVPRIVTLRVAGQLVAFHYFFALERTMYVHRLAFDPALARISPGQICTLEALRAASEEGLRRVEFLGGAERYKAELADSFEPMHQGLGLATTLPGHLAVAARAIQIDIRLRLKRSETLRRLYYEGLARPRAFLVRKRDGGR